MAFDPEKPVRTQDGRDARIICADKRGPYPIVALISDGDGESCGTYTCDGKISVSRESCPHDLINVPERKTLWMNVYDFGFSPPYRSREAAVKSRGDDALGLACLTVENGKIIAYENHPLDGGDDE